MERPPFPTAPPEMISSRSSPAARAKCRASRGHSRGFGLLAVLGLLLAACEPGERDTLVVAETIEAGVPAAATLHIDTTGSFWIGGAEEIIRLDGEGRVVLQVRTEAAGTPFHIGSIDGHAYFRTATTLLRIDPAADSTGARADVGGYAAVLDPRGRVVLRSEGAGTVVAHSGDTLEPVWGWAAVGAPSFALALSPEGDRAYQALGATDDGGSAALLARDLFTGRILNRVDLPEPWRAIVVAPTGDIFGAGWEEEGRRGAVTALVWEGGELRRSWRRTLDDLDLAPPLRFALSPSGDRVAVLGTTETAGLHLLDGRTGRTLDRLTDEARDVAFDHRGRVFLLYPDAVRRVE